MKYRVTNIPVLKKILLADSLMGGVTAIIFLVLYPVLTGFLGLPANVIVIIAIITLAYAIVAIRLNFQQQPSVTLLRILIYANWFWMFVSIALVIRYIGGTTIYGTAFLLLQVAVVAILAYLEGRHIIQEY